MAQGIAKGNVAPFDYYSDDLRGEGAGVDPISAVVDLDQSGAPAQVASAEILVYYIATEFAYTEIELAPIGEDAGVNWQIAGASGGPWLETLPLADQDARAADKAVAVYLRALVDNDGTVGVSKKTSCKIQISARGAL
ncbi:hypothetical protein [Desulfuromonas sp. TF]|uniref:hypothetical protein n=1 Tax=Desulfuromonas sp. TF TaxID=1232410 RepID=UPI0004006069|nr:hypothetical protein [Desulfuromonas sp. TF]